VSHDLGGRFVQVTQVFFVVAFFSFDFVLQDSIPFKINFFSILPSIESSVYMILLASFDNLT
jgi:hypothetical protein